MTYLELVQRLQQEAGVPGTAIAAVTGQTGELKRLCDWVRYAWDEIQAEKRDWFFLWNEFSVSLASGTDTYDLSAVSPFSLVSGRWTFDSESFYTEDPALGTTSRRKCTVLEYSYFLNLLGGRTQQAGFPTCFTVLPNNKVRFNCSLDRTTTFGGEYIRAPQTLAANADIPLLPSNYHLAILYRALHKYAIYEEASGLLPFAIGLDDHWTRILCSEQLPRMAVGAPPIGPAHGFANFVWPAG